MDHSDKLTAIEKLKQAFEVALGHKCTVSNHFDELREYVFQRTGQYVSSTTLKRIWGYLNEPHLANQSTLNLLAIALGYSSWDNFQSGNADGISISRVASSPKLGKYINVVQDLKPGDRIKLFWNPGRECLIEFIGDIKFKVIKSVKTRLKPGDIITTHIIVPGHPLYLYLEKQGAEGAHPIAYICGRLKGGVQYKLVKSPQPTNSNLSNGE